MEESQINIRGNKNIKPRLFWSEGERVGIESVSIGSWCIVKIPGSGVFLGQHLSPCIPANKHWVSNAATGGIMLLDHGTQVTIIPEIDIQYYLRN